MNSNVTIILGDDDEGHTTLIKQSLEQAGLDNKIIHISNGQAILDFFFENQENGSKQDQSYVILLDIRMPKVDGIKILEKMKSNDNFRKHPIIMFSTMDDPIDIEKCHELGCNGYIIKPIEYDKFLQTMESLGRYLKIIEIPSI